MKKVAIIYSGAKYWGGIETYLAQIFSSADRKRLELVLFSLGEWELTDKLISNKAKVMPFSGGRARLRTIFDIKKELVRGNYDLVVTQGNVSNLYGRLAGRLAGITVVTTIHSEMANDYPNPWVRFVYICIDRFTRHLTTKFIAVSEFIKKGLVASGITGEKIAVVYNGAMEPRVIVESPKGVVFPCHDKKSTTTVKIVSIGRLHKVKNYAALIEACNMLPFENWDLTLIGEGEERQSLENQISSLGLGAKVHLLGHKDHAGELIPEYDIYVQPSLSEGFGITVVLAMYAAKPIVVTPVGSLEELITDGKTGLVTADTSAEAISIEIREVIENLGQIQAYGKAAREDALARFGTKKWLADTTKVYEETAE